MGSTILSQSRKVARTAADAAAMLAFPTTPPPAAGDATCAALSGMLSGAFGPRSIKMGFKAAGAANLTDGFYVGWNAADTIWEVFGAVNDGEQVDFTATRGYGALLRDVPGVYTHVSVVGVLSASTLTITVDPMEGA